MASTLPDYGSVLLASGEDVPRQRRTPSRRFVLALGLSAVLVLLTAIVVTSQLRPLTESELLAKHYGAEPAPVFSQEFWNSLYTGKDDDTNHADDTLLDSMIKDEQGGDIIHHHHHESFLPEHTTEEENDFANYLGHVQSNWNDVEANKAHKYHVWHTTQHPAPTDFRSQADDIAERILNHYESNPDDLGPSEDSFGHATVPHKLHHWAHWYHKCHPTCHEHDSMWPVEKRLAAKLLYLWDHWHVAPPTFNPAGGVYVNSVVVTIVPTKKGEIIHFTTDGSTPTKTSPTYMAPIHINKPGTVDINAFAISQNMGPSAVSKSGYVIQERCAAPTISPSTEGPFTTSVTVTLQSATPGATLEFTTDGSDPAPLWHSVYNSPFEVADIGAVVIKARATKDGMAPSEVTTQDYSIQQQVETPTITPTSPGPYISSTTVTFACGTPGADLHYSIDGNSPKIASLPYTGPFEVTVTGNVQVQVYATKDGMAASDVATQSYHIMGKVVTPVFTPATATFVTSGTIQISTSTPGAKVVYTVDGSVPSVDSTVCNGDIVLGGVGITTVKAMGVMTDMGNSDVAVATYTILAQVATPVITPTATEGPFTTSVTVTITSATPTATITYTLDGTTPSHTSIKYSAPFDVAVLGVTTVKAIAWATNMGDSNVATVSYTVQGKVVAPTITPLDVGPYVSSLSITMATLTPGATIHYTTDGSTPTPSSPAYSAPVLMGGVGPVTISAVANEYGMTDSEVTVQKYTVLARVSTPIITPTNGPFVTSVAATLTCNTPSSTIHYTTDGSAPTAASPPYHAPFTLSTVGSVSVSALCSAAGMADSAVATQEFTVIPKAPAPTITPASGSFVVSALITITTTVPGGVIHYTTDGSAPTLGSAVYSGPVSVAAVGDNTIQAMVAATNMGDSDVTSATVFIQAQLEPPTISPDGGSFRRDELHKGAEVTLTAVSGATIYYTTDGTAPTTGSIKYLGDPFVICSPGPHTITAIAAQVGLADSPPASAVFTVLNEKCLETIWGGCGKDAGSSGGDDDTSGCDY